VPPTAANSEAVVEALFEVRFTTSLFQDLIVGNLAANWADWSAARTPLAAMPAAMRLADPNLAAMPTIELRDPTGRRIVKIGEAVLSYHRITAYPLWPDFKQEIEKFLNQAIERLPQFRATRSGLRYVNVFNKKKHGVTDLSDLDIQVLLAGKQVQPPLLINYRHTQGLELEIMARLASREFVDQMLFPDAVCVADFDAYTPNPTTWTSSRPIARWLERAHGLVKREYIKVIGSQS
jgi:hypothetical protein